MIDLILRYLIEILLYDENGYIFIFVVFDKYLDECFVWFNFVFVVYDRGLWNFID